MVNRFPFYCLFLARNYFARGSNNGSGSDTINLINKRLVYTCISYDILLTLHFAQRANRSIIVMKFKSNIIEIELYWVRRVRFTLIVEASKDTIIRNIEKYMVENVQDPEPQRRSARHMNFLRKFRLIIWTWQKNYFIYYNILSSQCYTTNQYNLMALDQAVHGNRKKFYGPGLKAEFSERYDRFYS